MVTPVLHSAACLNCGSSLSGPFCSTCGQRDIPPYPSTRELVIDAFWELSGWDGRFASTVRALVERPGKLTREFLEGRRARYLSPLRLYLLASLVYFVLAAAVPEVQPALGKGAGIAVTTARPGPERVALITKGSLNDDKTLSEADRKKALADIEKAPALMRPFLRRAVGDPKGFKRGILETMPKMLFVLLPVFAAIVALFYRGRKYPEHLYFAIHLHAFVFLALCVTELSRFTRLPLVVSICGVISLVWLPVYATLAFRRVYGGSIGGTLLKEAGIGMLYCFASVVGFAGMVYWVALVG